MDADHNDMDWEQRFSGFRKAFTKLTSAISVFEIGEEVNLELEEVDDLLKEGFIKRFEFAHELAWNVMKDYAGHQGNHSLKGPEDSTREGVKMGLISDAGEWMAMLSCRKEIAHMYELNTVNELFQKILESYYLLFSKFENTMEGLRSGVVE
jgi:nucleotidyltransferase substrate binding protein (TIGR01987 family)